MGHTGSVHRGARSHRNSSGTLYGEPLGTNNSTHQTTYTPAQMQALYLSRGRPDMAFMSNQSVVMPEMQQTCTVKNHVNLKKNSLKLVPSAELPERYSLEFQFDATKACQLMVYIVGAETIDDETGCSTYSPVYKDKQVIMQEFPAGLGQNFSLEQVPSHEGMIDFATYKESELVYEEDSLHFPLIITLEVFEHEKHPQSQTTFCTFFKKTNGTWDVKMLKQKIQVDGLTYELQEIYGIDGSVAAAPKSDLVEEGTDRHVAANDEIDIPDGAECIICMSEPRNTTVLPCRHMCLCGECAEALRKNSSTCPICRTRVEALLQIRVEAKG